MVAYGTPPVAIYKLNQRDVPRIEQAANTALDFMPQQVLLAALEGLGVQPLPLDGEDQAALAPLGYVPPAACRGRAKTRPASGGSHRRGRWRPRRPAGLASPSLLSQSFIRPAPGLVAAVIVLGAVVLLIFLSGPALLRAGLSAAPRARPPPRPP